MEDNVLIVGEWRNSMTPQVLAHVTEAEERESKGFRQLPYESTVTYMAHLLDGYDRITSEFLNEE